MGPVPFRSIRTEPLSINVQGMQMARLSGFTPLPLAALAFLGTGVATASHPLLAHLRAMMPAGDAERSVVAAADVDGDGDVDLVLGAAGSFIPGFQATLSIRRNDGNGRFVESPGALPYVVYTSAQTVLPADLDGDGDVDLLIVQDQGFCDVAVNDGTGQFQIAAGGPFWATTYTAAIGDFDGDGVDDALLGVAGPDQLLRHAPGGFQTTPANLPDEAGFYHRFASGDVDGDGDADVVEVSNKSLLYLGDGAGGFVLGATPLPAGVGLNTIPTLADLDADGDLDLILTGSPARVYRNDGAGHFTFYPGALHAASGVPPISVDIRVADVDVDGDPDLLIRLPSGTAAIYLNDGTATLFEAPASATPIEAKPMVVADVDGDGDPDLAAGRRLRLNDGDAHFVDVTSAAPRSFANTSRVRLADVDLDGDLDVLMGGLGGGTTFRLFRFDDGELVDVSAQLGGSAGSRFAVGDLNGDAAPDLVVTVSGGPMVPDRVRLNDGTGSFVDLAGAIPTVGGPGQDCVLLDLDQDGDLDGIIARLFEPSRVLVNDGTGKFQDAASQPLPAIRFAVAADVDNDADADLVFLDDHYELRLFTNDGTGVLTDASVQLPASGGYGITAGDVEPDGDVDLWIAGGSSDVLLANDGSGQFADVSNQIPPVADPGAAPVVFADFDGDGDLDVATSNEYLFRNLGGGIYIDDSSLVRDLGPQYGQDLAAGDVDADGDVDLVWGDRAVLLSNTTRQLAWRAVPRIGKPLTLDLFSSTSGGYTLLASAGKTSLPLPPFGTLRVDPAQLLWITSGPLSADGEASVTVPIPNLPALVDVVVYWQALVGSTPGLTNLEATRFTDL